MSTVRQRRRLDRYELLAEIASGGMGIVLLARLVGVGGFQRLFAIKVMHPHLIESPHFVAMLLDEARVAARIHHPNVVATVDVRTHANFYYIIMDYVDGFQLARVLDDPSFEPRNRIRVVNRMLLDTMIGLEAAHNLRGDDGLPLGIVHRDVSPQNILIGIDGIGRLTDFGIALAATRITASRPGMIKGKPSYLAPEQARAQPVDRRADLWPLGVILWEAFTGRRLFAAENEAATVLKVVHEPIPTPKTYWPGIPPELEAVCMRALERDPEQRFRSAREMALALERGAARADLLADAHEVAEHVNERFGAELELRRRAIQAYSAALPDATDPVWVNDLYSLPKLGEEQLPLVPSEPRETEAAPTLATPSAASAASAASAPISAGPASSAPEPTTSAGTTAEPVPAKRAPKRRISGVPVIAAVALFAGLGIYFGAREPEPAGAPVAGRELSGEPTPVEKAAAVRPTTPEASAATVHAARPETSPVPSPAASPPHVEPLLLPTPTPARPTHARSAVPARPGVAKPAAAKPAPGKPAPAKPGEAERAKPAQNDTGLPIEQNPYRFR